MKTQQKWLLCLVSVLLFSAGWHNISGLTSLVALVPILLISHTYDASRKSFWKMVGWASVTFGLWNILCAWWIWYATPSGPIASTLIQVVLIGGIFMIYHYVSKRVKSWIAYLILICGWIAAEYLYLTGELSFPWLFLGNAFANDVWAVQWYQYTGVFGGTLWVLLSNVLLSHAIIKRSSKWLLSWVLVVVIPITISLTMFWSYEEPVGANVKVAVIQPNIDALTEKFVLPEEIQVDNMLDLALQTPSDIDLIVLPETAIDSHIWEEDMWVNESIIRFGEFIRTHRPQAEIMIGATTHRLYPQGEGKSETAQKLWSNDWCDKYNSAIAIDSTSVIPVYHKKNLVVGPEKMPYKKTLKFLENLIVNLGGTTRLFGVDGIMTVFSHRTPDNTELLYSAPVCYDSVYGQDFATFTVEGANLMTVITNDGWWHDTPGYRQHFSFSRLRAIETRRFVARSANTGISGFISPRGDVMQKLGWEKRGVLTETLTLNDKVTFYAKHGDYIGRISNYVFLSALALFLIFRTARRLNNRR